MLEVYHGPSIHIKNPQNTDKQFARKPKQYHCKLNSTKYFSIHKKKVHSEKGPKHIPFYLIPRYLVIAKKDLNLHSEKSQFIATKGLIILPIRNC